MLSEQFSFLQYNAFAEHKQPTIAEREDEYRARRRKMIISPERNDPFADGKEHVGFCILYYMYIKKSLDIRKKLYVTYCY